MMDQNSQAVFKSNKKSKKPVLVALILVIAVTLLVFAGITWASQIKEYKRKDEELTKKIDKLESQLKNIKSENNSQTDAYKKSDSGMLAQKIVVKEANLQFDVPAGYPEVFYKLDDGVISLYTKSPVVGNFECQLGPGGASAPVSRGDHAEFGSLVSNTKERYEELGTKKSDWGKLIDGKYWSIGTVLVCDDNNPGHPVNILKESIIKTLRNH